MRGRASSGTGGKIVAFLWYFSYVVILATVGGIMVAAAVRKAINNHNQVGNCWEGKR